VLALPPALNVITVYVLNIEVKTIKGEIKNGMFSPLAYIASNTLVQLPMMLLISLGACLPAFAVGGWPWDNFGTFVLAMACSLWGFECMAQFFSLQKNPIVGMLLYVQMWSAGILFCGLVFKGEDVIWPFRLLYYILPLKYMFNAGGRDIFIPTTYAGALSCAAGVDTITTTYGTTTCGADGFYCPDSTTSLTCLGQTGAQVLDSLHHTYESVSSKDDRVIDIVIMLGIGCAFKLMYIAVFARQCSPVQLRAAGKLSRAIAARTSPAEAVSAA